MRIKAKFEIVTGLLESGKTTFINELVKNTLVDGENLIIIQWEDGNQAIDKSILSSKQVLVRQYDPQELITKESLKYIIELHKPHRIIIEYNGSRKLEELLILLDEKELAKICRGATIYSIIDANTFDLYINNMAAIMLDGIYNSNLILLNNTENIEKETLKRIINQLESFNADAFIIKAPKITEISSVLKDKKIFLPRYIKKVDIMIKRLLSD